MSDKPLVEIFSWPEIYAQLSSYVPDSTADHLTIVTMSRQQLSDLSCPALNPAQLYSLAESLISLAGNPNYTPTAFDSPIPLRLDVMLRHLLGQPPDFRLPLLRNWCEWFGLHPSLATFQVWTDFTDAYSTDLTGLPDPFDKLGEQNLICVDTECFYIPLSVAIALAIKTKMVDWDTLPTLLHKLRYILLHNKQFDSLSQSYQQLTAFLRMPHPSLDGHKYRTARARGVLVDLPCYSWSSGTPQPVIDAILVALQGLYESDASRYQNIFNRVHGPVWNAVGRALDKLEKIESRSQANHITIDATSYIDSTRLVSHKLKSVAKAFTVLTELETTLGVDRYLGGQALTKDLSLVHNKVQRIGKHTHQLLDTPRQVFLQQWNLTNVAPIVLRLLDLPSSNCPLTDYFPNDHLRVIFVLVDALGYTQFQWFLDTVGQRTAAPLASNIFAWLREQRAFNDSYVLASNLVSITGSCLPTIYTGALPRQTGVIGSHMLMEGHHLNVLTGTDEHHKLESHQVAEIYQRNVDKTLTPFAQIAHQFGVNVQAFHGGSMSFDPLVELTYGKLRNEGRLCRVRQADRIFAEVLPAVVAWKNALVEKHLALVYYPLIDHSGHGRGPYTQFQTAELNKLNFVFTHFLVDMAHQAQELFDGRTSVIITADHGMFESAVTAVSHRTVRKAMGGKAACRGMDFVYDNRAMFVYGIDEANLAPMRQKLADYFEAEGLPIATMTRKDPLVTNLLCDPDGPWAPNCPDLILQFYGPGVFYYDENLPSHMFLYGAHGGISVEETFVPLIHFTLTPDLVVGLKQFL